MKTLNLSPNLKKYLFWIFILINLFFLFEVFSDLYDAIKTNWIEFLNYYVINMQNIIFFFALLCLFTKKFQLKNIIYIIPFAILEHNNSFFSEITHPILMIYIYPLIFENYQTVSAEYARIIFFSIILLVYLFHCFYKRSFHTIFLTLSMLGVFFTTALFHTITINQIDYFSKAQDVIWYKLSIEQPLEIAQEKCKLLSVECQFYKKDENIFEHINNPIISQYKPFIEKDWLKEKSFYFYTVSNDIQNPNRLLSRKPVAFIKNNQYSLIISDSVFYKHYLMFNQFLFGILAFFSHVIWIAGALYLIYFHDKKIRQRALVQLKNKNIDNTNI